MNNKKSLLLSVECDCNLNVSIGLVMYSVLNCYSTAAIYYTCNHSYSFYKCNTNAILNATVVKFLAMLHKSLMLSLLLLYLLMLLLML